jgi:hypothetical protein
MSVQKKNCKKLSNRHVCSIPRGARSSTDQSETRFPIGRGDERKIRGRQRHTHGVVFEHRDGQDGWFDEPKREERKMAIELPEGLET